MKRLDGRIAVVTGSARGMGAETVRLFVCEGARVIIADMLEEEGRALASELGEQVLFVKTDVSNQDDWASLLYTVQEHFGTPDILVNNAAVQRFCSILESDEADFRHVLDVNLLGAFLGLKVVGGEMVRTGRGSIVNISSVDGLRGANGYAAYCASKWGVRGLTKVAAMEFGPRGVRVNSIHPGGINTVMGNPVGLSEEDINQSAHAVPLQRFGNSREVANASLFLASDEASYICGAELAVDGGWSAGVYNSALSGAPEDFEYAARVEPHPINAHLNQVLTEQSGAQR